MTCALRVAAQDSGTVREALARLEDRLARVDAVLQVRARAQRTSLLTLWWAQAPWRAEVEHWLAALVPGSHGAQRPRVPVPTPAIAILPIVIVVRPDGAAPAALPAAAKPVTAAPAPTAPAARKRRLLL